ncbi:MAG: hypothetical protein P8Z70_03120 [Desulfuromonadales bacterium]|jgi:hypothetical protein
MKKRHGMLAFLAAFSLLDVPVVGLAMSHEKLPAAEGQSPPLQSHYLFTAWVRKCIKR